MNKPTMALLEKAFAAEIDFAVTAPRPIGRGFTAELAKAEDMRRRKLASLKKKIALLESMDFTKADIFSKGGE